MPPGLSTLSPLRTVVALYALLPFAHAGVLSDLRYNYFAPAPAPEDGPAFSANALRNKKYLPLQAGAIVGAYAVALIFVALGLLFLSKTRREHLLGSEEDEAEAYAAAFEQICSPRFQPEETDPFPLAGKCVVGQVPNFSYKSPTRSEFNGTPYIHPPVSPAQSSPPGVDIRVDQAVVMADRTLAQDRVAALHELAMQYEEAKEEGREWKAPVVGPASPPGSPASKKKPKNLNLEKKGFLASAKDTLDKLKSPGKSKLRGINISSPIMTPQTATFPRHDDQEMRAMPARHYAPAAPPPVPAGQGRAIGQARSSGPPPEEGIQSIDGRLGGPLAQINTAKEASQPPAEGDPESAVSQHSQAPLLALPTSPGLPSSPKPGATFRRVNPPSAVRPGGTLPLREYESLNVDAAIRQTTKQTLVDHPVPLSPAPSTANLIPYSPYMPNTPCIPFTPTLVTRKDRKEMKKRVPKTPTVNMVQDEDRMW